jgi:hypothetical protein
VDDDDRGILEVGDGDVWLSLALVVEMAEEVGMD